jgi:hypothetical protein
MAIPLRMGLIGFSFAEARQLAFRLPENVWRLSARMAKLAAY